MRLYAGVLAAGLATGCGADDSKSDGSSGGAGGQAAGGAINGGAGETSDAGGAGAPTVGGSANVGGMSAVGGAGGMAGATNSAGAAGAGGAGNSAGAAGTGGVTNSAGAAGAGGAGNSAGAAGTGGAGNSAGAAGTGGAAGSGGSAGGMGGTAGTAGAAGSGGVGGGMPTPSETSAMIQAAHDAGPGAVSLPISGAVVTYSKPATGDEPAAFFVQAEQLGPALLVEVDPASLAPAPAVGMTVSFQVDDLDMVEALLRATQISNFTVHYTGADVEALRQDVSGATDLLTNLDDYESELISITGTVATSFEFIVLGHEAARLDTIGTSDDGGLVLRLNDDLVQDLGLEAGCTLTLNGIMWRTFAQAQPSGYVPEDLTNVTCSAPVIDGALATAADNVVIDFNRWMDATSVTPDGSQFTFSQGLTASAAFVSGSIITVTTSPQTPGTNYTVAVAGTVLDVFGAGVGAPGSTTFDGYTTPASVLVNEVKCVGDGGPEDYIELYVTSSGPMGGFTIEEFAQGLGYPQEEYRFDPDFSVTTGDFVVLHYDSANQGNYKQEDDAGSSKNESNATDNVSTAWDVYVSYSSCEPTESLVLVRDNFGTVVDSVALSNRDGTVYSGMRTVFNTIRADSSMLWTGFSADADGTNDAQVQNECASFGSSTGMSAQRDNDYTPGGGGIRDTNTGAEWCAAAQTMGATSVDCP